MGGEYIGEYHYFYAVLDSPLQDSIGDNARTNLVANIHPSARCVSPHVCALCCYGNSTLLIGIRVGALKINVNITPPFSLPTSLPPSSLPPLQLLDSVVN